MMPPPYPQEPPARQRTPPGMPSSSPGPWRETGAETQSRETPPPAPRTPSPPPRPEEPEPYEEPLEEPEFELIGPESPELPLPDDGEPEAEPIMSGFDEPGAEAFDDTESLPETEELLGDTEAPDLAELESSDDEEDVPEFPDADREDPKTVTNLESPELELLGTEIEEHEPAQAPAIKIKTRPDAADQAKLLDYLLSLADTLPEKERADFRRTDFPLKIESVKNRLLGRQGLIHDFPSHGRGDEAITPERVRESLDYFARFAGFLPNREAGSALKDRLGSIADRFSASPEDRGK